MKTNNLFAAAVLVSAVGLTAFSINASAASSTDAPGKTRAQVRAELIQARADGFEPSSEAPEIFYKEPAKSTVTRAQVKAELAASHQGQWRVIDEDYQPVDTFKSTKTRAQVKAELLQAQAEEAASGHHPSPEE